MRTIKPHNPVYFILCCTTVMFVLLVHINRSPISQGNFVLAFLNQAKEEAVQAGSGAVVLLSLEGRRLLSSFTTMAVSYRRQSINRLSDTTVHADMSDMTVVSSLGFSRLISGRRSMLHLDDNLVTSHEVRTKKTELSVNTADATMDRRSADKLVSENYPSSPRQINVDVSATFHVDYSSPKTHPPKNN
ncbi:hypothetical protein KP509_06G008100 [Ceratopteris richardii]|uniref:Uncharacterized protein n=1 Tax=Ceratopteris richardii TaxID=49495 RepID=A0A8T2UKA7_CERRI|nr:hypothetical protein KP509_06G008100 [Ceratopteris richardii]